MVVWVGCSTLYRIVFVRPVALVCQSRNINHNRLYIQASGSSAVIWISSIPILALMSLAPTVIPFLAIPSIVPATIPTAPTILAPSHSQCDTF
ncbi:hypothetical protein B9Z19DRAFT_1092981 [Tuber borchii]|uniref:Uncharacterized protein n=1 Tax=Tuber borchii TaxID=42251 RepID=A0A2T6ZG38_TUBBO|nr:hypothetical protein B9Z19DRAFT_1092981 [Tuber borchii]